MRLIFVRHGETDYNKNGIIQGQKNVRMNRNGLKQVKLLVKRLKNEKIDAIYSSDLIRCKHVTKEIVNSLGYKIPVVYTKELREKSFGHFEGKRISTYKKHLEKEKIPTHLFKTQGSENWLDLQKRIVKFFNKIKKKHQKHVILISTHGGVIKTILLHLMEKDLKQWADHKVDNTSVSIVEFKDGKPEIKLINCTKRLDSKRRK